MFEKTVVSKIVPNHFIDYLGHIKWVAYDKDLNVLPLGIHNTYKDCEEAIVEYQRLNFVGKGNREVY